jgi:predicted ATPase
LRATLDWSYELLTEAERVVLRRLGVFAGAFSLEAASAVVASAEFAPFEVVDALSNLATKSLIAAEVDGTVASYRLLDTTRAYALKKLDERGERARLARRHAECYRDLFERAAAESETRPRAEWLAHYGRRIDSLRAALDWAFSSDGDASVGVALTAAAVPLWTHFSLMEECHGRVERALVALASGSNPDTRREMQLQTALAASLIYTRGAVPEFSAAWTKGLEIAERLDDAEYRLPSLWGLWSSHIAGGRHRIAQDLAQRFCTLAPNRSDPDDRLLGDRMIGVSLFYLGDLPAARRHLERVLADYVTPDHRSHTIRFQIDLRATARAFLSRILWLQGFPEQAVRAAEGSIEDARAANHAMSLCYALAHAACPVALWVGDLAAAENYVGMLLDHSTEHALPMWYAWGRGHQGVLIAQGGDVNAGLRLVRAGLDELGEAPAAVRYGVFQGSSALALAQAGQVSAGLAAINEAIAWTERTEERWAIAEFLHIKGELILLQGAPEAAAAAEDHFRQALDWARRQGTLSRELRAATSLARFLRQGGRSADALALLQPVYDRFTEGFRTTDLKTVKALLDALQ